MKPLRIVVVEDDAVIAYLCGELLESLGHEICACVGCEAEAICAAALHHPDLMIVDERIEGGSGVAAMSAILETGHVPHVYVTGNVARVRALAPGSVIIPKPYREDGLVAGIIEALNVKQAA